MKKGQVSIYVIVGLVILILIGFGYYFTTSRDINAIRGRSENIDFSSLSSQIETFTKDCLMETTLKAIDYFGPDNTYNLKNYIESNLNVCLDDYKAFTSLGIDIKQAEMKSDVASTENALIVGLEYPVVFSYADSKYELEPIEIHIEKGATLSFDDGIIPAGTQLISSDKRAIIRFDEDTIVRNAYTGLPVTDIQFTLVGKNIHGLENNLVINNLIYEGTPDGTLFDPPPRITFNLEESRLTADPNLLKVSYFDEKNGIWHSLNNNKYDPVKKTISADLGHFSLNAVNLCGEIDGAYPIEVSIADPYGDVATPLIWNYNFDKNGNALSANIDGIHLLPDVVDKWGCSQNNIASVDSQIYDEGILIGKFMTHPEFTGAHCQVSPNNELFQDWDNDDNYNIDDYKKYDYLIYQFSSMSTPMTEIYVNKEQYPDWMKLACLQSCEILAKEKLFLIYPWMNGDEGFISGDGINDFAEISCQVDIGYTNIRYEYSDIDPSAPVTCYSDKLLNGITDVNINSFKENLYESDPTSYTGETYNVKMDGVIDGSIVKRTGFFATPKTPGYKSVKSTLPALGLLDVNGMKYGAVSEKTFSINDLGNNCIHNPPDDPLENIEARLFLDSIDYEKEQKLPLGHETIFGKEVSWLPIILPEIAPLEHLNYYIISMGMDPITPTGGVAYVWQGSPNLKEDYSEFCSDKCIWSLNSGLKKGNIPGELKAGENTISLQIFNIKDAALYAKGTVEIYGKGVLSHDCTEFDNSPIQECTGGVLIKDCEHPEGSCCPTTDYCVSETGECLPTGGTYVNYNGHVELCDHSNLHECNDNGDLIFAGSDRQFYICDGKGNWHLRKSDGCAIKSIDDVGEGQPRSCEPGKALVIDCWNGASGCCSDTSYCVDGGGCKPTGFSHHIEGSETPGGFLCDNSEWIWCKSGENSIYSINNQNYYCNNGFWTLTPNEP